MRRPLLIAASCFALALTAACGSGDDDDPTPAPSPMQLQATPPPATATTSASPTAAATPSSTVADTLAQSPQYFLYYAGKGDTLTSIARAFATGTQAFATQVRTDNQLASDTITEGQPLAIRLTLPGDLALIPDSSMEAALGIGGAAGKLQLLQPSLDMRSGYKGLLLLHRVTLSDDNPSGEGRGYLTEYWTADRPPIRAGEVDKDARAAQPEFVVGAGSLIGNVPTTPATSLHRFTRDGVEYAVYVFPRAQRTAAQIAEMLQTAKER